MCLCCFRSVPHVWGPRAGKRGLPDALQLLPDAAQGPLPIVSDAGAQPDSLDGGQLPSPGGQPPQHVWRTALMRSVRCRVCATALYTSPPYLLSPPWSSQWKDSVPLLGSRLQTL